MEDSAGLSLEVTDKAKEKLIREGTDPQYGARPLRRAIQRLIEDPMSELILRGGFRGAEKVLVDVDDEGNITFTGVASGVADAVEE